jgi:four helix bundle protein
MRCLWMEGLSRIKSFPFRVLGFPLSTQYKPKFNGESHLEPVDWVLSNMKIDRFEQIEAWQLARELTKRVYRLTYKDKFAGDFGLKRQIQTAAGSSMNNIAEGFDSDTNAEFLRFLRYAKRSCSEIQSELYIALDQKYISESEFKDVYDYAGRTRATIRGFIKYLLAYARKSSKKTRNREPQKMNGKRATGNGEP